MKALSMVSCVAFLMGAFPLFAQEAATLPPGVRVRITDASGARLTGRIHSTDAAALNISRRNGEVVKVPRAQVARLEVGFGRNYGRRGAIVGGVLGLAAGLAVDAAANDDCGCVALPVSPVLAMAGTGVGFLVGTLVRPARWSELPLDRVRIGVAPVPGRGAAVRVSFAF